MWETECHRHLKTFSESSCTVQHHTIKGFQVTSYQANFASHHTHNRHVGFLLAWRGIGKYNKMFRYFFLVNTIPNYNSVIRILAHTLGGNFESFCEVNQKLKHFLFFSIPHHSKRKPGGRAKSRAYRYIPRRPNPLYAIEVISLFTGSAILWV